MNRALEVGGRLLGLVRADVLGTGVSAFGLWSFVFGSFVVVVVLLMRLLVGLLAGKRRTGAYRAKQGRNKEFLHKSNANTTLIATRTTPVTSVLKEQPGQFSEASERPLRRCSAGGGGGGDDGDDGPRRQIPDLRTPSEAILPRVS